MLSQIRNFSIVAKKLNITQPALSKQILHLESELGIKLFDRNSNPLVLTPAGEYFIREAKELLYKEDQLLRSMERYKSGQAGQLTVGITPFRSSYLIPKIMKELRERFPETVIKLHEAGSDILRKEVADGKYDFAVVNLPVDDSVLDIRMLEPDRLVLAVPKEFEPKISSFTVDNVINFKDCKELPFVVVGQSQEMRNLFDKLCAASDFTPTIAAEVVGLTTAWSVARSGVGATILPRQFVEHEHRDGEIAVFDIKNAPLTRQPAVVTRRGQVITDAAAFAIELLTSKSTKTK